MGVTRSTGALLMCAFVAAGATGCGSPAESVATGQVNRLADIAGTYELSHASSPPSPMVPGVPVRVEVFPERIGLDAGCNAMNAFGRVEDSRFVLDSVTSEAMACEEPPSLMDQEDWIADLFRSTPVIEYVDGVLTITADSRSSAGSEPTSLRFSPVLTATP
jgi:heat shock protein HslJ